MDHRVSANQIRLLFGQHCFQSATFNRTTSQIISHFDSIVLSLGIPGRSGRTDRPRNDLNWPWDESGLFISPFSKIRIFFEANVSLESELLEMERPVPEPVRRSAGGRGYGTCCLKNFPDLYCDAIHKTCNTTLRHMSIHTIISNKKTIQI